jgi:hypothetical protein
MATVTKFPRQLAATVGQHAAATGVKFWPGHSSDLGEKVASGLVWRFGTFGCVRDNLAHFKDGLGDSGSFLDVGSHRFYVAKPFKDLRAPLNRIIDPARVTEALERTRLVLLCKVAEDEDAQHRMSTKLREFHDAQGGAPVELAPDPRCGHGLTAMGPGQVQRSPSASQGRGGHRQGGRAPSYNA